jgi:GNAT superfamily N-acetyltransferase
MTVVIVPRNRLWKVDRLRRDDRARLGRLFSDCSPETVRRRFFGRLEALPARYLDAVVDGPPERHDAVVVRFGDGLRVAGLGSLAAGQDADGPAELAVLVADAWQRRGVGAAMVEALVSRAAQRGVELVSAAVLPECRAVLGALARRLEPVAQHRTVDELTGVFRVPPG